MGSTGIVGWAMSEADVDWAYLEDFCRRLTTNFEDVYVFT
jgi:hypothetical protein